MVMMMMMTMTQQQQQQQQLSGMVLMAVGSEVSVYDWAVMVAGIFMIFSLALSTFLLFDHLSTYNDPEVMKQNKNHKPGPVSYLCLLLLLCLFSGCLLEFSLLVGVVTKRKATGDVCVNLCVFLVPSQEQKWLIGVIFMVPVYVVTSVCHFNPVYSKILRD
jgi:hypothetical protein